MYITLCYIVYYIVLYCILHYVILYIVLYCMLHYIILYITLHISISYRLAGLAALLYVKLNTGVYEIGANVDWRVKNVLYCVSLLLVGTQTRI